MEERDVETPKLESAVQRLEDEVLFEPESFKFLRSDRSTTSRSYDDASPTTVKAPVKVREMITTTLGNRSWDTGIGSNVVDPQRRFVGSNDDRLREENKLLKSELDRMERLLTTVVSERDDIAVKYSDISGRFESTLKNFHDRSGPGGDGLDSSDDTETSGGSLSIMRQNAELRRTLNEEQSEYRRKLQSYQDSQQKHVLLVEKLQAKVLQYKKRCNELEDTIRNINFQSSTSHKPFVELQRAHQEQSREFEQLLKRVDEEVYRANNLVQVNEMLKEQLSQSNASNRTLNSEVQRLSDMVREFQGRQNDWRREEQEFNESHNINQQKLMTLWKAVSSMKKSFESIQTASDRDIANMSSEMSRISRLAQNACLSFVSNSTTTEEQNKKDLSREQLEKSNLLLKLNEMTREINNWKEKCEVLRTEKHEKSNEANREVENLKTKLSEKDHSMSLLQLKLSSLDEKLQLLEDVKLRSETKSKTRRSRSHKHLNGISKSVEHLEISGSEESDDNESQGDQNDLSPGHNRSHSSSPVRGNKTNKKLNVDASSLDSPLEVFRVTMHKKQMEVLQLKNKLLTLDDQNHILVKNVDDLELQKREIMRRMEGVEDEKRKLLSNHIDLERSHDELKNAFDQLRYDFECLENSRRNLLRQLDESNEEKMRFRMSNGELHKVKDTLSDDKNELMKEKERLVKERERNLVSLEQNEFKMTKLKQELMDMKEQLNKSSLGIEILEQEKKELGVSLSKMSRLRGDLELELGRYKHECTSLRDALLRLQCINQDVGNDNSDLKSYLKKLEAERATLMAEKSLLEQERNRFKEDLNQIEHEKLDLENENSSLQHNERRLKESKGNLEIEFQSVTEEKTKLQEQLNSCMQQKIVLNTELASMKQESEELSDSLMKLAKEKEELSKNKENLINHLTDSEREARKLTDEVTVVKAEKESYEVHNEELCQEISSLEDQLSKLKEENHEFKLKVENLNDDVVRLNKDLDMAQEKSDRLKKSTDEKIIEMGKEHKEVIKKIQLELHEQLNKTTDEKARLREQFEHECADLSKKFSDEKNEMMINLEKEKEKLKEEMEAAKHLRDQQLAIAEQEKHEMISTNEADRSKLLEKLTSLQREMTSNELSFGKLRRELEGRCGQHESTISILENELKLARLGFDKMRSTYEKESKKLASQFEALAAHKNDLELEISDLRVQLKSSSDAKENLKRDLNEMYNNMMKLEAEKENTRKENSDLLRSLREESYEKEMSVKVANDHKVIIKKLEAEKLELNRVVLDARQQLTGLNEQKAGAQREASDLREVIKEVEKGRLEIKKELQEFRRQTKSLEVDRMKMNHEMSDYHSKMERLSGKVEELKKEVLSLKQKHSDSENSREALQKENNQISRRLANSEKDLQMRDEVLKQLQEDTNRLETRRNDEKARLEMAFDDLRLQASNLETKLNKSEAKARQMEDKTSTLETEKVELEIKLSSLITSVIRNLYLDDSSFVGRTRSISPSRRRGRSISNDGGQRRRNRSVSPGKYGPHDVDIEELKMSIRDFSQRALNLERERDDACSKLDLTQSKLTEMLVNQERLVSKLEIVMNSMEESEKVKKDLENKLVNSQSKMLACEDEIKRGDRDSRNLAERVANLEVTLKSVDKERVQLQEKVTELKHIEKRLEDEKKLMKQAIDDGEKKLGMSESGRRVLEGEVYRMKMTLNDKETENQVANNRLDQLFKQIEDLESRAHSYQTMNDRLNSALIRCSEEKTNHKDQVNVLNMTLSDKSTAVSSLQEKLAQLQRSLASSEQERMVLQERFDDARQALGESKRQMQLLKEKQENLQVELKNSESRRIELEAQSKLSHNMHVRHLDEEKHLNEQINLLQVERHNLQEMVVNLQRTLAEMEADVRDVERSAVRLKKDKNVLKKSLNKSEEYLNKTAVERTQMDRTLKKLEDDNFDLLHRVQTLQLQLATVEQEHRQRLLEITARHRDESELELEHLVSAKLQAEKLLESRERTHRQNIKNLEEQVANLRDRLNRELRLKRRQQEAGIDLHPDLDLFSNEYLDSFGPPIKSNNGNNLPSRQLAIKHEDFSRSFRQPGENVLPNYHRNDGIRHTEANGFNKRSTSPAKVVSTRVTRHRSPPALQRPSQSPALQRPSQSPGKSLRPANRK